jgi:hypothetical protein
VAEMIKPLILLILTTINFYGNDYKVPPDFPNFISWLGEQTQVICEGNGDDQVATYVLHKESQQVSLMVWEIPVHKDNGDELKSFLVFITYWPDINDRNTIKYYVDQDFIKMEGRFPNTGRVPSFVLTEPPEIPKEDIEIWLEVFGCN